MNRNSENKFKNSLKEWEDETRPFVRVKENKERDEFDYKRKWEKLDSVRREMSKEYNMPIEKMEICTSRGVLTNKGNIIERTSLEVGHNARFSKHR